MMTELAERLRDELLNLSDSDRAEMMDVLRDSLGDRVPQADEEAWEAELNRRFEEMESGKASGRPAAEIFEQHGKRYA